TYSTPSRSSASIRGARDDDPHEWTRGPAGGENRGRDPRGGRGPARIPARPGELLVRRGRDDAPGPRRPPGAVAGPALPDRRDPGTAPPAAARGLDRGVWHFGSRRAGAERALRARHDLAHLLDRPVRVRCADGTLGRLAGRVQP